MQLIVRREKWRKYLPKCLAVLVLLWIAGTVFANNYRIGIDQQKETCLPGYNLYLIDLNDKEPRRGEVYAFRAKGVSPIYEDGTRLVKILRGMPGDTIRIDQNDQIFINEKYVGCCLHHADTLKQPRSNFHGKATLGADKYWFMGTHQKSFDSRYWGTASNEQIIGRAIPIM